jgi:hypothetical protein
VTFQQRLDCPHSYAVEESKNLMCDIGEKKCDGKLYNCCLWDIPFSEQLVIVKAELDESK